METPTSPSRRLVLASTSRYRRELLARLGLAFDTASPGTDESRLPGESPRDLALRLAAAKAAAVAPAHPDALIIGSDQVAWCDGEFLGKPGTHERAVEQLRRLSGRSAEFLTAVCVLDSASGRSATELVPCEVRFRRLDAGTIERYLRREQPYDCAGSAKSEGLGIVLLEAIRCDDPNALVGLPLIALTGLLAAHGVSVI